MKQRVLTAAALLCLLALVVWQINTPFFVAVIAVFSAIAANEIMKCSKLDNKFILIVGTAFAAAVRFLQARKFLCPWLMLRCGAESLMQFPLRFISSF
jgi:CDP-diglyceride synthetase